MIINDLKIKKKFIDAILKESTFLFSFILVCTILGAVLNSCSNDDPGHSVTPPEIGLDIKRISIPSSLNIVIGGDVTIIGQGFVNGDKILLVLSSDTSNKHLLNITTVTDEKAIFALPKNVVTGEYSITVVRGNKSQLLGSIILNIVTDATIPDVAGMTIKGIVSSDGKGIEGVVVSDGYEVTTTDADGIYYIKSEKKNGYVFISVPGNYEATNDINLPQFFQRVSVGTTSVEQRNFSLIKTDNNNHVVLAMADWHLAARNNDLDQFTNKVLPDINATIAEYKAQGAKVYGLTLGDLSWDAYWYENKFALPQYLEQMNKIKATIYNVMGNHDNDPYSVGDWQAALPFKTIIAPNYYSFNLGDIHYVVLDDTEFINAGGAPGVVGARNYNDKIVQEQLDWLQKDLATIKDKNTPVVVAMHIPLYGGPSLNADGTQKQTVRLTNGPQLETILSDFNSVRILTGHSHINYTIEPSSKLMEYNTGAICATWWWTGKSGYAGNHICKDGSPGGYGVWEMDGKSMKSYYKSIGYGKEYQFRSYDMNNVRITAEKFAPKSTDALLAPYSGVYANPNNNNEVMLNVWGYDDKWKIEVKEDGKDLAVERVVMKDPLHIISYEAFRLNVGATPTDSFITNNTAHLFEVKASSSTSTLEIKVTDRFGRVYTESMKRPKEFSTQMK